MDLLKKSNKIKSIPVDSADRTEIQTLVSRKDGAPNFELRKFKIMPGVKHWYKNDSKDVGEFLCIVPKTDNYETIYSD